VLQSGWTPLHHASQNGHLEVVRYLIEKCGVDVNVKDSVSEFDCPIDWIDVCFSCPLAS
jgi:ankyrin repeat protein